MDYYLEDFNIERLAALELEEQEVFDFDCFDA